MDFNAELSISGRSEEGRGQIVYALTPHPRLECSITLKVQPGRLVDLKGIRPTVKVVGKGSNELPVYISRVKYSSVDSAVIQAVLRKGLLLQTREKANRILLLR